MAQTLRGDLTSHQEAALIDLLTDKVSGGWLCGRKKKKIVSEQIRTVREVLPAIGSCFGMHGLYHALHKVAEREAPSAVDGAMGQ